MVLAVLDQQGHNMGTDEFKPSSMWTDEGAYNRPKGSSIICKHCKNEMQATSFGTIPVWPRPTFCSYRCPKCTATYVCTQRENTPENDFYIISDEKWELLINILESENSSNTIWR